MSYALLNLWVRDVNGTLLKDAWRMDLVVKSGAGEYLVNQDEQTIANLQTRYPSYSISKLDNYMGATRIKIVPPSGQHIYHLEMDLPPGCWVIWARMCHGGNEETNKIFVVAQCGQEICAHLLLNQPYKCSEEGFFPIAVDALLRNVDLGVVEGGVKLMKNVANLNKEDLLNRADLRLAELQDNTSLYYLQYPNQQLRNIIAALPDSTCC